MDKEIKILVLGDGKEYTAKVGKTTLIKAFNNTVEPSPTPSVYPPSHFNNELSSEGCAITVIDTPSESEGNYLEEVAHLVVSADAVILVYDLLRPETLEKINTFWMNFITTHSRSPILIAGNKVDLGPHLTTDEDFENILKYIVQDYEQCEELMEISAKNRAYVPELFQAAQRAALYPSAALYDSVNRELKLDYKVALKTIFRLCDRDKDSLLNDHEFNAIQGEVFNRYLESTELGRVREVLKEQYPEGVSEQGIKLEGFIELQKMMIQRQKVDVCWKLLRHFSFAKEVQRFIAISEGNFSSRELGDVDSDSLDSRPAEDNSILVYSLLGFFGIACLALALGRKFIP